VARCEVCWGCGICEVCDGYGGWPESFPGAGDSEECEVCAGDGLCVECAGTGDAPDDSDDVDGDRCGSG